MVEPRACYTEWKVRKRKTNMVSAFWLSFWLRLYFSALICVKSLFLIKGTPGEGNGNPFQCSCLENPRDGGAWWAAIYGVTQSQTWLKWCSSSSSSREAWHAVVYGVAKRSNWTELNLQNFLWIVETHSALEYATMFEADLLLSILLLWQYFICYLVLFAMLFVLLSFSH